MPATFPPEQFRPQQWAEVHADFCNALAQDFKYASRYLAFERTNENSHSIEFVRLLLDACSEVEALAKITCTVVGAKPLRDRSNVDDWRTAIISKLPSFPNTGIIVCQRPTFHPWKEWGDSPPTHPAWWQAYQDVKHDRSANFRQANLVNVTLALCAMMAFALLLFDHKIDHSWFRRA